MEISSVEFHQHNKSRPATPGLDFSINTKHSIVYLTVFICITAAFSYVFSAGLFKDLSSATASYIFTAIFLMIGITHIFTFPKWLSHLNAGTAGKGLAYSFILAALISAFVFLLFYLNGLQSWPLAVAAGCAFILPYMVNLCRVYYLSIGTKEYKEWVIPADAVVEKRMSLLLNSLFFQINIKIKYSDKEPMLFNVTLPGRLSLSAVFCRFLYDQQDKIEVADSSQNPYAWRFSVKGRLGKRMLDPDATLKENHIKESDVIFIERIILL